MKIVNQIKYLLFSLVLLASILGACGEPQVEKVTVENTAFNFTLSVKQDDLFYDKETGYPANVTFVLVVEPSSNVDLVTYLTESGLFENKQKVIHYLSFELQKQLQVEAGEKLLQPVFCHFERSFDLKKKRTFLASFDLSTVTPSDQMHLSVNSKIFGEDTIDFDLSQLVIYKS